MFFCFFQLHRVHCAVHVLTRSCPTRRATALESQRVQGLAAGGVLPESCAYTITAGDGDTAAAALTIPINGSDDGVTVNGLAAEGAELIVDEDNLADGSSPDAAALTQDGSFSVSAPDGLANVSVGGEPVVTNGAFTPGAGASPLGPGHLRGFSPVNRKNGGSGKSG